MPVVRLRPSRLQYSAAFRRLDSLHAAIRKGPALFESGRRREPGGWRMGIEHDHHGAKRGGYGWYNAAAFSNPVAGTFGNCGRDNLRGPKTVNFDFSAIKHFAIGERQSLQFRVEMFNAPNHVELGTPGSVGWGGSSNVARPSNFGVITSTFTSMRQIQLALKYNF